MFEHVGRDEPRKRGGFDGSRVILGLAAAGIMAAGLFLLRDVGARAAKAWFGPPVEVVYLSAEELPPGEQPGAVTAAPLPDPPPPPEPTDEAAPGTPRPDAPASPAAPALEHPPAE
jgi:hypothetical protein